MFVLNVKKVLTEKLYQEENSENKPQQISWLSSGHVSEPHSTNSTKPNQWLLTNLHAQQLRDCQSLTANNFVKYSFSQ